MEVQKQRHEQASGAPVQEDLEAINRFAKSPLAAEEVYTFSVRLCDNEVDRDGERFDAQALSALGDLFVGKSGIFDHRWSAQGQTARLYRTEVVQEKDKVTAAGDPYCYLKGWAYLLRTEKNQDLIREIEGGIKKEVSVGCSMKESVCSICGAKSGTCGHVKGERYSGKLCYCELREPVDAYEWSFVAVPAQPNAGVMKRFSFAGGEQTELLKQAELGKKYLKSLRGEVVRLAMLADDTLDGELFARAAEHLEEEELLQLHKAYAASVSRRYPAQPQLRDTISIGQDDETVFLV